jgi:2-iminobutanoate/2-iminopropanoate deaminase
MTTWFAAGGSGLVWLLLQASVGCAGQARHHDAPGAIGPYSAVVEAQGLVFVAGQVGRERSSFAAEVGSAIDGVATHLARVGLGLQDVVSTNVYLVDIGDFAAMNEVYARRFPQPWPARTTVGVKELPGGARIEIQCVAARR